MAVDEMVIKWSMDSQEFNSGLTKMNKSMSVLKSEFNATSNKLKAFGNETDQLKNKQKYLTNAMTIQKSKVETLSSAYKKQVEATGKNSTEAQNLAIKLNNQIGYYNKLQAELNQTNKELKEQTSVWNKVSSGMDKASKKMSNLSKDLADMGGKLTLGLTTPLIGLGATSFEMASDMDESLNKVQVACGDGAEDMKKFSDTTLETFGIAKGTALDMIATFSDMGTGMGLESAKANEMSKKLVGLAGDLSSFKNIRVDVAKTALNGIYTGETESLKQLGIVMTQANLEEYAHAQGIKKKIQDMSQAEQVQLRYNYVLEKTKNAQGDFARTSDGAANQQRIFTESLKELGATFGENLLPVITPFIKHLNEMLKKFGDLDKTSQQNIIKIGLFAATIGPAASILGKLTQGIGNTISFVNKAGNALKLFKESQMVVTATTKLQTIAQGALNLVMSLNPITLIIAGLVALGATFAILYNKCEWFRNGVQQVWGTITSVFQIFDNFLTGIFSTDWTNSFGILGNVFNGFFASVSSIWESIKQVFSGIITFIRGVFQGEWSMAWEGVKNIFGGIMSGLGAVIKAPLNAVIGLINMAIDGINSISFTAPDWIPGIGGKHFGVDLPKINYLYQGGIIDTPTMINANTVVGDSYKGMGRQAEVVAPLGVLYSNIRDIVRQESNTQPIIVNVNVANNMDSKAIGKAVTTQVSKEISRSTNNYRRSKGGLAFV